MAPLVFRQFAVLFWKNWIVLSRHKFLNIIRCFLLPVGYGIFLAVAQIFLSKPNNFGIGNPAPIRSLDHAFSGSTPLWWADGTNGTLTSPSPSDIMARVTRNFTPKQLKAVRTASSTEALPTHCPQNFNGFSECFAAIAFDPVTPSATGLPVPTATSVKGGQFNGTETVEPAGTRVSYTILGDAGLFHIDAKHHTSDFEKRILPIQWALDEAIISLDTGVDVPTPLEWPFSQETNTEQFRKLRLSYIRGIRSLLVLALFICYIGIAYQLPGAFMGERTNLLTSHLKVMGLYDSARITSWHLSHSLAYLPAWVVVALVWHFRIFTGTHVLLVLVVHVLFGLTLGSYSLFLAAPFGNSPQLAAVFSTFFSIVLAILALVLHHPGNGVAFIFSIIFPPGWYVFAIFAICGWENHQIPTNALKGDPDLGLRLLPLIVAGIIDIFLWPWLAVLLERRLYDAREPKGTKRSWFTRRKVDTEHNGVPMPPDTAISIRNLNKTFEPSWLRRRQAITAVEELSFDVPKRGIFVLLGSNGAGKSTTLSMLSNLLGRSSGSIRFEGGHARPPRGTLGIVPQKNVFFPDLTCAQNLRVWRAVKQSTSRGDQENIEQLLRDCDLGTKVDANASTLSGGQKRKLQLAAGLIGGSNIVLVDECTSGVDPLSRRALWRILTSVRHERTIIFTTHFLDEADLLGDHIAILAAPGKLVAQGSPVSLKRDLGDGYKIQVTFDDNAEKSSASRDSLISRLRTIAPHTYPSQISPSQTEYHLKSKDPHLVEAALQLLSEEGPALHVVSYDVHGTSIEDIFLGLMAAEDTTTDAASEKPVDVEKEEEKEATSSTPSLPVVPHRALDLTTGRPRSPYSQAFTIFHKRFMITRRSWLTPLFAVLVAICGSCIPLFFMAGRDPALCVRTFRASAILPLYFPISTLSFDNSGAGRDILASPPNVIDTLGLTVAALNVSNVVDNVTFVDSIRQDFRNLSIGGVSINTLNRSSLVAWEASPPGYTGLIMLNLASNLLYNTASNSAGNPANASIIAANYQTFPPVNAGVLVSLKWIAFFGAAMAVYPAFFSLYVSRERRSSVQAMQLSNGLSDPIGLWLGHLLFDSVFSVFSATVIVIVFAVASDQFNGLGFFWFILVLYGLAGSLFAYCVSLFVATPLAAFAIVAGYQIIMYILYLAAYLLILTYAKTSAANSEMTIIHFTLSLASPVASVMRAAFVSVNLFSLLCSGNEPVTTASLGILTRFGGPILYLLGWIFILFAVLVWVDSGSLLPRRFGKQSKTSAIPQNAVARPDVEAEAKAVATSEDALRVLNVSKTFGANKVVQDVTFGVARGTIFSLLGPNGAGKSTTFGMVAGDITPDRGNILIENTSVVRNPRIARLALGVCPQFTAIDPQLTVREHLRVYGRLKGLRRGEEVERNIETLMRATTLDPYAERLASQLSGGNQRKLALAIALMGNPSVVLIDEYSSGIDPRTRREMWGTLRAVSSGKAIVITTHSMEEAAALANKVGILAKRLLAVGTTEALAARYATYEVHFTCRTREDVTKAQELMARIPGSRMADDVATRFEVSVRETGGGAEGEGGLSLARLFGVLAEQGDFSEYTVERPSLESVFLKVIREANVAEEDNEVKKRRWWRIC